MRIATSFATLLICAMAPSALWAHPEGAHLIAGGESALLAGLLHPLLGLDHLLAMMAVGLLAAKLGGAARVLLPMAFVACLFLGVTVGALGLADLYLELGVSLSLVILGALIIVGHGLSPAISMAVVAAFALIHGLAHGSSGLSVEVGFSYYWALVFGATLVQLVGLGIGEGARRVGFFAAHNYLGAMVAASGIYFVGVAIH